MNESGREFRVVWRWKTNPYRDEFSDERHKVYKTEAGARKLLALLNKDDGKYEHHIEVEPTHYEDGLIVEHWRLDYARLETRTVAPWSPATHLIDSPTEGETV